MSAAEFRVARETMGVSTDWVAEQIGIGARAIERYEAGETPVTERASERIDAMLLEFETQLLQVLTSAREHQFFLTFRRDSDVPESYPYPAAWHRSLVRVARPFLPNFKILYSDARELDTHDVLNFTDEWRPSPTSRAASRLEAEELIARPHPTGARRIFTARPDSGLDFVLPGISHAALMPTEPSEPDPQEAPFRMLLLRAIARQLETVSDDELRLSPDETVDDIARRFVASRRIANDWDSLVGPFLDTAGVMSWLEYRNRQNVRDAAKRGDLLALPVGRRKVYPLFQFSDSGQPLPHLRKLLPILNEQMQSPWTQALWLNTPVPSFDGQTPAQMLHAGRHDEVLTLAFADMQRRAR